MKVSEMFPSKWLAAEDLQGKEVPVVIAAVRPEKMLDPGSGERIEKYVVYFERKKKGLVLNKTNAKSIAEIVASEDTDEWVGREIVLVPTKTKAFGELVDCVRVKPLLETEGKT